MATTNPILSPDRTESSTPFETETDCGRDSRIVSAERVKSIEEDPNAASEFSCFVNLCNTILGSGLLGLPYAFSRSGWFTGTILLVVCGSLSSFALHCLAECALREPHPSTFYSVAQTALPKLTSIIDAAVAIKCFGVGTSYLIVIGDLMPEVMEHFGAPESARNRLLWVTVGFSIVAPLSFLKDLDSLKFTSMVAIFFVGFLTFLIILYASDIDGLDPCEDIDQGDECVGEKQVFLFDIETMKVFSIFVFGFTCHQNIFAVKNELIDPTISRINMVIVYAIGTAGILYLVVGCFGYETYGDNVESDILVNYPGKFSCIVIFAYFNHKISGTELTSTARLFVSLLVAFSYPLQAHPARKCILTLLSTTLDANKSTEPSYHVLHMRYIGITVSYLLSYHYYQYLFPECAVSIIGCLLGSIIPDRYGDIRFGGNSFYCWGYWIYHSLLHSSGVCVLFNFQRRHIKAALENKASARSGNFGAYYNACVFDFHIFGWGWSLMIEAGR